MLLPLAVHLVAFEIGANGGSTYTGTSGADTLAGSAGNDLMVGLDGSDDLSGGSGDDVIYGGSHASESDLSGDTLAGEAGDDWLYGGYGGDLYLYDDGDGLDTLVETRTASGNLDVLSLGPGIDSTDVDFEIEGADLVITHLASDIIRIRHWYLTRDGTTQIEEIQFDDLTVLEPGDLPFSGNEVTGTASGDVLNGTTGQINRIFGGDGNDLIYGKNLADVIGGELGNDTIYGGDDIDIISGDAGNDTLGGDNGNDELLGGDGTDTLNGGSGDDHLTGGLDNDNLNGGNGSDVYYWNLGDGDDTVADSFTDTGAGIINRLVFGPGISPADVRGDAITSYPNDVKFVISQGGVDVGSVRINYWALQNNAVWHNTRWTFEFADGTVLTPGTIATEIPDRLEGGSSSELFYGLGGSDTIIGNDGDDTIDGGEGNDYLTGGNGADTIVGGNGLDTLIGGEGNDSLDGGAGSDILNGDNGDDVLLGGEGADTINGGGGADQITGGTGNDTLNGGNGSDEYFWILGDGDDIITDSYFDTGAGIVNRLTFGPGILPSDVRGDAVAGDGNAVKFVVSQGGVDVGSVRINNWASQNNAVWHNTRWSFEFDNGTIWTEGTVATQVADRLEGGSGADTLSGLGGGDTIIGNDGNDTLDGGEGNDYITGGNGTDTLVGANGIDTLIGGEGNDSLDGGNDNDTLNGDNGDDTILGGAGVDTINAGSGNDAITGGTGNDALNGGNGSDEYFWNLGDGADTIADSYIDTGSGIVNRLTFGPGVLPSDVRGDVVSGDSNAVVFVVSQSGVDVGSVRINNWASQYNAVWHSTRWSFEFDNGTIWMQGTVATQVSDRFEGGSGAETFAGLGGNDTVFGNDGDDTLDGGEGGDYLSGGSGWDTLIGGNGADTLYGGDGNDSLDGGDGNDSLNGDNGNDTILGGAGTDTITGGTGDDLITGGSGNDTINGGNGSDVYFWSLGDGDDTITDSYTDVGAGIFNRLHFGPGILPSDVRGDTVPGSSNDRRFIISQSGVDVGVVRIVNWNLQQSGIKHSSRWIIEFDNGTEWSGTGTGTSGADLIEGGSGADTLAGFAGDDQIQGFGGNDMLDGGDGADSLFGGDGADELNGGTGNDVLQGGIGSDLYRWNLGDGHDIITDSVTDVDGGTLNRLLFGPGIAPSDVRVDGVEGSPTDVKFVVSQGGSNVGSVRINGWGQRHTGVQHSLRWIIEFDNGTDWLPGTVVTPISDWLIGGAGADAFDGLTGDDVIFGNGGDDVLEGGSGADSVYGGEGADTIGGGLGGDFLDGDVGDDELSGGSGDDTLEGGAGSDVYLWNLGDGHDTISDDPADTGSGIFNRVVFGPGIASNEVTVQAISGSPDDAKVVVRQDGVVVGSLRIQSWFEDHGGVVHASRWWFTFDAGDQYLGGDLPTDGPDEILGTLEDDVFFGHAGGDHLTGAEGEDFLFGGVDDDLLEGGVEDDVYYFESGDGSDQIVEVDESGVVNRIEFGEGVNPAEILLLRVGDSLVLIDYESDLDIEVVDWFASGANRIAEVEFSDSTVWDATDLATNAHEEHDGNADGIDDVWSWLNGVDYREFDNDGDGLLNPDEVLAGSDPHEVDSDDDGFSDWMEVGAGTDPAEDEDPSPPSLEPIGPTGLMIFAPVKNFVD